MSDLTTLVLSEDGRTYYAEWGLGVGKSPTTDRYPVLKAALIVPIGFMNPFPGEGA